MKQYIHGETTVTPSWHSTRFDVGIRTRSRPTRHQCQAELQQLKAQLLEPILEAIPDPNLCQRIHQAANEALAAAWGKPHPFLLLPYLLEQKVREAQHWFRRQQQILGVAR